MSTKEVLINTLQASVIDSVNQPPNVHPVSNATVYLASNGTVHPASNDTVHLDIVYLDTVHFGIVDLVLFILSLIIPSLFIRCQTTPLVGRQRRGGPHPKAPVVEHTRIGSSIGTQQKKGWDEPLELCRTLSGSVDGNKENAPETRGTSNETHGDVGYVDMCVFSPVPGNPGRKWERGGRYNWLHEEIQGKLIGVLEPWKFALVKRMAGQPMEAERTLTRRVVAISSSEEEVEEDPSKDSE
ncbi:hypothetical protein IGI04_019388 [Brassica rapa subsp. trilocularis]|uniref:Uncharacterized protein n=1 Tax=Brassica rapa subsp. trilocularis TaxID=1813537 RepID=A0ABQ7MJ20_BRACM|nr:hypothetical protein IGI04_019388 [Brassica rapa subsp. trilocularis]